TRTSCSAISTPRTSPAARSAWTCRRRTLPSSGWPTAWGCRSPTWRGASTTSSTRTWPPPRACTSPSAAATRATTPCSARAAPGRRLADGRFLGQGFDLVVDLPDGPYDAGEASRARLTAAFETAYREKFALTPPDVPIEFINIRVAVRAPVSETAVTESEAGLARHADGETGPAVKGTRRAYFRESGDFVETTVYDRARLALGDE